MQKSYETASVKSLARSRVEISASVSAEAFAGRRAEAVRNLNEAVTVDGFRKGKVPEGVLVQKVGEHSVLEEMAELAVGTAYPSILIAEKIDAVGRPEIRITKMAPGNSLEFTAVTAVVPSFELPDYRSVAAAEMKKSSGGGEKVSDAELDEAILRIRRSRVPHEGHDHAKMTDEEHEKAVMAALPGLTDDFVRGLGDFSGVPDFRSKLSAMLAEDKKSQAREKRRIALADAIEAKTRIELPDVMVESELDRSQAQFAADVERMGLKAEDYLKHAKKTMEDLRKDWRPNAEKKAKLQLIVNAISEKEDIRPSKEAIEAETDHILEHYKDADRERALIYAETVLTNEKVFEFLEKQN